MVTTRTEDVAKNDIRVRNMRVFAVFFVANVYHRDKTSPSLAPPLELRKSKHVGRVANLHMNFGRQFVTLVLASALLSGFGCEKKKPQLPSQAKAPVETSTDSITLRDIGDGSTSACSGAESATGRARDSPRATTSKNAHQEKGHHDRRRRVSSSRIATPPANHARQ